MLRIFLLLLLPACLLAQPSKFSHFGKRLELLETERRQIRDSIIQTLPGVQNFTDKMELVNVLFQIGDSVSLEFLFANLDLVFNAGAWHSNTWGQYPIAGLLSRNARGNLSYYPYIRHEICKGEIIDDNLYFMADMLANIFLEEMEILYISLHKLLQQHPENKMLETNIRNIKNVIENH